MNILITNIGRRDYLVDYLKDIKGFNGKVYTSDCSYTAPGLYGKSDGAYILPRPVDDEVRYVTELIKLCKELKVSIVIPVIDPEIYILSNYISMFQQENIWVVVSSHDVLDICYNKLLMNEFLKKNGFLVAKTFAEKADFLNALNQGEIDFPVYIKPVYGSGSATTYKVNTVDEFYALYRDGLLIQEVLEGYEYGIDVFNDRTCRPVRCVVKKKLAMRSGETDKSISVVDLNIQEDAIKLAKCLGHIGNLDCDLISNEKGNYFIDLNPRFGGGYPATHATGVNYLKLILESYENESLVPQFNNYSAGLLVMKTIRIYSKQLSRDENYNF